MLPDTVDNNAWREGVIITCNPPGKCSASTSELFVGMIFGVGRPSKAGKEGRTSLSPDRVLYAVLAGLGDIDCDECILEVRFSFSGPQLPF